MACAWTCDFIWRMGSICPMSNPACPAAGCSPTGTHPHQSPAHAAPTASRGDACSTARATHISSSEPTTYPGRTPTGWSHARGARGARPRWATHPQAMHAHPARAMHPGGHTHTPPGQRAQRWQLHPQLTHACPTVSTPHRVHAPAAAAPAGGACTPHRVRAPTGDACTPHRVHAPTGNTGTPHRVHAPTADAPTGAAGTPHRDTRGDGRRPGACPGAVRAGRAAQGPAVRAHLAPRSPPAPLPTGVPPRGGGGGTSPARLPPRRAVPRRERPSPPAVGCLHGNR